MYMSGGINEKALKVSNDVVHIIEHLRSNHEEAATLILLNAADQARQGPKSFIGSLWQAQMLMCLFFVHHFS